MIARSTPSFQFGPFQSPCKTRISRLLRKSTFRRPALSQSKEEFNKIQEKTFDTALKALEIDFNNASVFERLETIVKSSLPLPDSPRVIDAGCGIGALIPHLRKAGIEDILAVDLSQRCLERLEERFPPPGTLGNTVGVRSWHGDFADLPLHMGPVDVIFFNSVFGNLHSPQDALLKSVFLLQPEGKVVVSHPLGRRWHSRFHERHPDTIPHLLPSGEEWSEMLSTLPLEMVTCKDETKLYITVLQVPKNYSFDGSPTYLKGKVILGKGIGSKKLGVPTANLSPEDFQTALKDHSKGVYFGWCKVHGEVFPSVFNLGVCPTMKNNEGTSLEAHILHNFAKDFYSEELKVALVGFLRPEVKFSSPQELLRQIEMDVGKARNQLKQKELLMLKDDEFFV